MEENQSSDPAKDPLRIGYISAGLGSGMGLIQPTFEVNGSKFIYTFEQNSYYGEPHLEPDTLCIGTFRQSSIDSILNIAATIDDTLVYRTNIHIMSGGIVYVWIKTGDINLTFQMHNAFDTTAQKIVDVLNTNIPTPHPKLRLSSHPDDLGLNHVIDQDD
jgi:hypothetical protein